MNPVNAARQQVDPVHKRSDDASSSAHRPSTSKRLGKSLGNVVRRSKGSSDLPQAEHLEGRKTEKPG
ncbi:MAG: hypothetical protein Q9223_006552 [Gallowayella weberi]